MSELPGSIFVGRARLCAVRFQRKWFADLDRVRLITGTAVRIIAATESAESSNREDEIRNVVFHGGIEPSGIRTMPALDLSNYGRTVVKLSYENRSSRANYGVWLATANSRQSRQWPE